MVPGAQGQQDDREQLPDKLKSSQHSQRQRPGKKEQQQLPHSRRQSSALAGAAAAAVAAAVSTAVTSLGTEAAATRVVRLGCSLTPNVAQWLGQTFLIDHGGNNPSSTTAAADAADVRCLVKLLYCRPKDEGKAILRRMAMVTLVNLTCDAANAAVASAAGAIPTLVKLLKSSGSSSGSSNGSGINNSSSSQGDFEVQRLAANVFTNILVHAAGNAAAIADATGAIPPLLQLLASSGSILPPHVAAGVQMSAARALLCLTQECGPQHRGAIACGAVPIVLQLLPRSTDSGMLAEVLKLLARLSQDEGRAVGEAGAIPVLVEFLRKNNSSSSGGRSGSADDRVLGNVVWTLGNLAKESKFDGQIAVTGAVPRLVELLVGSVSSGSINDNGGSCCRAFARMTAAGALMNLVYRRGNCKLVVSAGGIPPLVELLQMQECSSGTGAGGGICRSSSSNNSLAECHVKATEEYAAAALALIAASSVANADAIVKAGGVPPMVKLLASPVDQLHKPAVMAVGCFASSPDQASLTPLSRAIPSLVHLLLKSQDLAVQRNVTSALSRLAAASAANRSALAGAAGGGAAITRLVQLLHSPDARLQCVALEAVANLAAGCGDFSAAAPAANQAASGIAATIVEVGSIPVLVELLLGSSTETGSSEEVVQRVKQNAAAALANLAAATAPPTGQDIIAAAILDAGGIPALVRLLQLRQQPTSAAAAAGDGGSGVAGIQQNAVWALSNLALRDQSNHHHQGETGKNGRNDVGDEHDNDDGGGAKGGIAFRIVQAGGIKALVGLLSSSSNSNDSAGHNQQQQQKPACCELQCEVAGALRNLAAVSGLSRAAIAAEPRGIPALVAALRGPDATLQRHAAATLANLALDADVSGYGDDNDDGDTGKSGSTNGRSLNSGSSGGGSSRRMAILQAGAEPLLVSLLSSGRGGGDDVSVRGEAAGALANLACASVCQASIAVFGGIGGLLGLLDRCPAEEVSTLRKAAVALGNVALDAAARAAIRAAGGGQRLSRLLDRSSDEGVRQAVERTLAVLASDAPVAGAAAGRVGARLRKARLR